jgi:streptogramin lyase
MLGSVDLLSLNPPLVESDSAHHERSHVWISPRTALLLAMAVLCFTSGANATAPLVAQFTAAQSVIPTGQLEYPYRVAVDASGNLYISDTQANEVLKETWSQSTQTYTESVVVSTGLATPYGIAVDSSGNVYIADNGHNRVVKETPSAASYSQTVVSTTALSYPTGVAVDASGNLYIADTGHGRILIEAPSGSSYTETVLTYSSNFAQITGIAVDSSGDIFVSDIDNNAVYEETYSAGSYTPSTIATSGLNYPYDIAVDGSGNLYISDFSNKRIVEETFVSAGSYAQGVFPTANLGGSLGLAVDAGGNLYIADTFGQAIKKETLAGGNFDAVQVGSASSTISMLFSFAGGYIGDTISLSGFSVLTQGVSALDFADAGSDNCSTSASYSAGQFCYVNVTLTPQYPGQRYGAVELLGSVVEPLVARSHNIHPEESSGSLLATGYLTGLGIGPQVNFLPFSFSSVSQVAGSFAPYNLTNPFDSVVDPGGNVYVADYSNNAVYKETLSAGSYTQSTVASGLNNPEALALDGAGNLYIVDSGNNQILMESWQNGSWVQSTVATGLNFPTGVAVDGFGDVYFSSFNDGAVYFIRLSSGSYSAPSTEVTGLLQPRKIAVDGNGDIFIADTGNSRVVEEAPNGEGYTQTVIGSGMRYPYAVAVGASGMVYVGDTINSRILLETPSGAGFTQTVLIPGPPAYGIAVDGQGNVYFPDPADVTVFKVGFSDPPSFSFASTIIGHTSSDSPQSATIVNIGNAALTLPSPGSGSNPAIAPGFELDASTTCPEVAASDSAGSLAANGSCVYAIDFAPTAASSYSGTLTLTDNSLNANGGTQSIALSGTGVAILGSFTLSGVPLTSVAGSSTPFVLTAKDTQGLTMASYTGTVQLTSTDSQAVFSLTAGGPAITSYTYLNSDAGVKTLYITFKTAGSETVTATDTEASVAILSSSDLVTAGAAATIAAYGATSNVTTIGALLGTLEVLVTDAFGNPVEGVTVAYAVPGSGPSAVLSSNAVQTTSAGLTGVAAYASPIAGGPYTMTASATGLTGSPVSFSGTNLPDGTSTAVTAAPNATTVYGSSVTLTATVTPDTPAQPNVVRVVPGTKPSPAVPFTGPPAVGPPTGTVSFYDTVGSNTRLLGTSSIGGAAGSSPNAAGPLGKGTSTIPGAATFSVIAPLGGTHSYTASYGADANFTASASTAASYAVTPAPVTITGPAVQPVSLPPGQAGAALVTVTGIPVGTGILVPTGSIAYTILSSGGATEASGTLALAVGSASSTANVPIPGTLSPGSYTIQVSYSGDSNFSAGETSTVITLTVAKITPTLVWANPAGISYGTSLNAILNAVAKNGSAAVSGVFTYTATPAGGTASAVTAATVLGGGTYTLTASFTPTDGSTYTTATGIVTLTVSSVAPAIALTSSANPQYVQDPIAFTATLTSEVGVPTGTVSFYDGATLLGTVTLTAGVATLTISSLAIGPHSLTAVYSGNSNFATVTSSALTQTVQDFSLSVSTASGGSSTATASPGGSATYPLVFTPVNGTIFPQTVNLTVSGLPSGATATLTPNTLPAGSGTTPVSLVVQLPNSTARYTSPNQFPGRQLPLVVGLILLPFAGRLRRTAHFFAKASWGRWLTLTILALTGVATLAGVAGCGGKPTGYFGQAPATYTLTITGTSGALSHSTTVTLTVE